VSQIDVLEDPLFRPTFSVESLSHLRRSQ
jgi:hypothetical protein